jgi:hypothetical protein
MLFFANFTQYLVYHIRYKQHLDGFRQGYTQKYRLRIYPGGTSQLGRFLLLQ